MLKKSRVVLLLSALLLCSCADTSELYPYGAYLQPELVDNVYKTYEGKTKEASLSPVSTKVLQNEKNGYFNGSGLTTSLDSNPDLAYGFAQAKAWHPSYFKEGGRDLYWGHGDGHSDVVSGTLPGQWIDQSSLYGISYSQTKKLVRNYPGFSRGVLSKLYNGQVMCNGWSYFALAALSHEGFGTMFPYELTSASYFAMVLRGGSDINKQTEGNGRIVSFDINVTFFKLNASNELVGQTVTLESVFLQANRSSNLTSLVGFTFADAGIVPAGIVGMAISSTLTGDGHFEVGVDVTDDFEDKTKGHDALCITEILFPDSSWN